MPPNGPAWPPSVCNCRGRCSLCNHLGSHCSSFVPCTATCQGVRATAPTRKASYHQAGATAQDGEQRSSDEQLLPTNPGRFCNLGKVRGTICKTSCEMSERGLFSIQAHACKRQVVEMRVTQLNLSRTPLFKACPGAVTLPQLLHLGSGNNSGFLVLKTIGNC